MFFLYIILISKGIQFIALFKLKLQPSQTNNYAQTLKACEKKKKQGRQKDVVLGPFEYL